MFGKPMNHNATKTEQLSMIDQLISNVENSNKGKDIKNYDYSNIDRGIYDSLKFSGSKPIFNEMQAKVYELHENYAKACMGYQKAAEEALDRHKDPKRAHVLIGISKSLYNMAQQAQFDRIDANKDNVWTDIICTEKDIRLAMARSAMRK